MASFQSSQIPPPKTWQDFESLCLDLWKKIWDDPNATKNGRLGQRQNGVDIVGTPSNDLDTFHAIQCKGKDNYTHSILTEAELEKEVEKAKSFRPEIKSLIIATTSPKDVKVERRARELTLENAKENLFSVKVWGWEDVVNALAHHPNLIAFHYSWLGISNNPNDLLFDFWYREVYVEKLQVNANQNPFIYYDIKYTNYFIYSLRSYINKFEPFTNQPFIVNADNDLKSAIINFNQIVVDILQQHNSSASELDDNSGLWTYWIDTSDLNYFEQGRLIEFKKAVLRTLFYHLIKAANYVISVRNKSLGYNKNFNNFVSWTNFNTFLIPEPFEDHYLIYSNSDIQEGKFYPGLMEIENYIKPRI